MNRAARTPNFSVQSQCLRGTVACVLLLVWLAGPLRATGVAQLPIKRAYGPEGPPRLVAQVGHAAYIYAVAVSARSKLVLSASWDGVRLWDVASGAELRTFALNDATALVFSSDNRHAAAAGRSGGYLLDLVTGEVTLRRSGPMHSNTVAFSPDGALLLTGGQDGSVTMADVATGAIAGRLEGHTGEVLSAQFSADGRLVVTGSKDRTVRLWDAASGVELRRFEGSPYDVLSASVSPSGETVFALSRDGSARVWDSSTGAIKVAFEPPGAWRKEFAGRDVPWVAFRRDGEFAFSFQQGTLVLYHAATWKPVRSLSYLGGAASVSPDGVNVVTAVTEPVASTVRRRVRLLEIATSRVKQEFDGYADRACTVAWAPDGRSVLTANFISGAFLWDLESGAARRVGEPSSFVAGAVFAPDGRRALLLGDTNRLVDVETGAELVLPISTEGWFTTQSGNAPSLANAAFAPDGRFVAAVGALYKDKDGTRSNLGGAVAWDTATGSARVVYGHDGAPWSVAISADGAKLLTGGTDGTARLWDLGSGQELRRFTASARIVSSVALSPDGRFAIAADGGATPRCWDLDSGAEVSRFRMDPHCAPCVVASVRYTPDGRFVVANGDRVRVWDAVTGALVRTGSTGSQYEVPAPDERLGARVDGCITELRDRETGHPICSLVALRDGTWVVIDSDGRFDASTLEGIRGLHWVLPDQPFEPLPIEIFMRDYFEPRLLPRLLAGEHLAPVRELPKIDRLQPTIRITEVTPSPDAADAVDVRVDVAIASQSTTRGVYDVRLFRDGRLVGYAPEGGGAVALDPATRTASLSFRSVRLPRRAGIAEVEFSAYAFNVDRVKSATARQTYALARRPDTPKGRAYVVCVGVNAHDDPSLDLRYAVNDASQLAETLSGALAGTGEYGDVVTVPLLADASQGSAVTKADIRNVLGLLAGNPLAPGASARVPNLDRLGRAGPDDLVVLTFACHGFTDARGDFYLAPSDVGQNARAHIAAGASDVLARCISTEELSTWLRDVDAGNMVMVIDACRSGALAGQNFKPGPMGNRGLGQLAFDKRMKILAATQADDVALEVTKLEHGLATYALITEGLGAAQADFRPKDAAIFLGEWLRYAVDRVPRLHDEIARGQVRAFGSVQPRIVRTSARNRDRDIVYDAAPRTAQRPALFDFSRDSRDVLLTRTRP